MNKILVVVDMQNDFIDGVLGTPEAQAIVPNIKKKIEKCRTQGYKIIFTRDTHSENYFDSVEGKLLPIKHCIENTNGWEICSGLYSREDVVLNKHAFGLFNIGDTIKTVLNNESIKSIEIVGVMLNVCVISNALILKSYFPNIPICVDLNCTAATSQQEFDAAVRILNCCHIDTSKLG